MSEEGTIKNEKIGELIKNQLKDKKIEISQLNEQAYAFSQYGMMKSVEVSFSQQEIAACQTMVKEKMERIEALRKEVTQLEGQLRK